MSGISNLPCGGDGKLDGFQLYEYKFSTDGDKPSDSKPSITFRGKGFLVLMASDNINKVVLETEDKRITISKTGGDIYTPKRTFSLSPSSRQYCKSVAHATYETHYLTMSFLRDSQNYKFVDLSKTNTVSMPYEDFRYLYYEPKNVLTFNEFLKVTFNFLSSYEVNRNIMIIYKPE